ncbi:MULTISPECIES: N-acetyltransferase [Mycobacteriaceae]|uniref:GNAT family acetyltransferase n=2 Tax=Mycolicibacterium mucogenicum TaxID=56689 RepID=A0A1A0MUZ5_MYCMU|nr:GNAT family N-acetyltransferase [Mycolicibacterium mucogenicum]OBA89339.1 GNAT family acetyltransferase [Mycolicibacterium mucogenicum]
MALHLIDLRPGDAGSRWWMPPFDQAVEYEHPHWWNRQLGDDPWCLQVIEDDTEVARVEFDDPGGINPQYANVPELGDDRLEIQFIEVSTAARGRGVGTQLVRDLMERHPDRRLFAYSEGADRFWSRLGWEPFVHPAGGYRTLFIQPAGEV